MIKFTVTREGNRFVARFPYDFETKEYIKNNGFRWDPTNRYWWTADEATARRVDPRTAAQARAEMAQSVAQSHASIAAVTVPAPAGLTYLPYQLAGIAYAQSKKNVLIADEMGLGKGQPRSAKVLTPSGWRQIGDLRAGDQVIGSQGDPIVVTRVYPRGKLPVYRVLFNDGASIIVDGSHLWAVRTANQQHRNAAFLVRQTQDLAKRLVDTAGNRIWRIPMLAGPVVFKSAAVLRIPAYIMGVLLGDGHLRHHPTIFTPGDMLVPAEVRKLLPEGYQLAQQPSDPANYRIVNQPQSAANLFLDAMRDYGLAGCASHERFIPTDYLLAPPAERIALLQGLMDTDGELRPDGHLEYSTASPRLADDVAFLVEGLGGTARRNIRAEPKYQHGEETRIGRPSYRVTINLPSDIRPVRAIATRWQPRKKYLPNRIIAAIEPAGEEDVVCIAVDALDRLYVTEHCIVTHNTIQAIGVINADPTIKRVLVVVPASLKVNWSRELTKWLVRPATIGVASGDNLPETDIVIANYDIIARLRGRIDARQWDLLVIDEAHYVKSQKAQRTRAVLGHRDRHNPAKTDAGIQAGRKILLTGTPIVNRPSELWTLVQALDPTGLGGNFFNFMKRYTHAHHNGYGWDFTGASNLDELQTKLRAAFMVRRLKADVLTELPAKRRQVLTIPANGASAVVAAEREMYERTEMAVAKAKAAMAAAGGDKAAYEDAVRQLRDARQYAFEEMSRLRRQTAVAKIPHVVEHVTECLENEQKIVVFCHHHEVGRALKEAFPNSALVTGEVSVTARTAEVDRFQHDPACRVFIGSIQAAGVGLTLTAAALVVFAELSWVPGEVSQAEDRLHRIGQRNSVLVQHLVFDDSVDSRMAHMIIEKQAVIDAALDENGAALPPLPDFVEPQAAETQSAGSAIPEDSVVPF